MARRLFGIVVLGWLVFAFPGESSAQSPRYLLSTTEIADLKTYEGKWHGNLIWSKPAGQSLRRVFAEIAGKRGGKYSGNNWSVLQTLQAYLFGPPEEIIGIQDRFLVGAGCRAHSCGEKASFIVDTVTGHVAFALVHWFAVDRRDLGEDYAVTQFMKTCANPELRAFAAAYFVKWAEEEVATYSRLAMRNESESKTLMTRC